MQNEAGNGHGWNPQDPERERVAHDINESGQIIDKHRDRSPKSEGQRESGPIIAGDLNKKGWLDIMNRVYDPDGISPTIHTRTGGGMRPKIEVTPTGGGSLILAGNLNIKGYFDHLNRVYSKEGLSPTIIASQIPKIEVDFDE